MEKTIIAEGKTTNEAIENGLKQLKVSKDRVDVKVLENEEKRSFFSILAPRVVKVELTLKEDEKTTKVQEKKQIKLTKQEQEKAKENLEKFLKEFVSKLPENTKYEIISEESGLKVLITNSNLGYLIGYRGETLYSLQNIMTVIAGKGIEQKVRVILDIEGYKAKREKTLEDLAEKLQRLLLELKNLLD